MRIRLETRGGRAPGRFAGRRTASQLIAVAVLGTVLVSSTYAAPAPKTKTLGFVATYFGPANYEGPEDCPQGSPTRPDINEFVKSLPADLRAQASDPLKQRKVYDLIIARGPHGESVCENPEAVVEPPFKTVQGTSAFGLNLTGGASGEDHAPNVCAHRKFPTGLNGEADVDNQLYRVMGCMTNFRGDKGFIPQFLNGTMRDGNWTLLIEVSGISNRNNDVQVGIYNSADPMVKDANGNGILSGASLQVVDNPHYHQTVNGKIEDGVLNTDYVDVFIKAANKASPEYHLRHARLKLQLMPDGTAKGVLAGYVDWSFIYRNHTHNGAFSEISDGLSCPAFYSALRQMADGYPDPETGECTALSAAYRIEAVPAFVIHSDKQRTADAR